VWDLWESGEEERRRGEERRGEERSVNKDDRAEKNSVIMIIEQTAELDKE